MQHAPYSTRPRRKHPDFRRPVCVAVILLSCRTTGSQRVIFNIALKITVYALLYLSRLPVAMIHLRVRQGLSSAGHHSNATTPGLSQAHVLNSDRRVHEEYAKGLHNIDENTSHHSSKSWAQRRPSSALRRRIYAKQKRSLHSGAGTSQRGRLGWEAYTGEQISQPACPAHERPPVPACVAPHPQHPPPQPSARSGGS